MFKLLEERSKLAPFTIKSHLLNENTVGIFRVRCSLFLSPHARHQNAKEKNVLEIGLNVLLYHNKYIDRIIPTTVTFAAINYDHDGRAPLLRYNIFTCVAGIYEQEGVCLICI